MRVLIVDDEPPARERLRRLAGELDAVEVVAETGTGREAVELADRHGPDVVLLDIRMPGMGGLEAAHHLNGLSDPPAVIFCTAYDDQALAAFEAHALDYLVKPIRRERLRTALSKADRFAATRAQAARGTEPRTHLCAQLGGRLRLIPVAEIVYCVADHKYVKVRYDGGEVLVDEALKGLEHEHAGHLLRVHRSALVARERLQELTKDAHGRWLVRLRGAEQALEVSRRNLPRVRRALKDAANTN